MWLINESMESNVVVCNNSYYTDGTRRIYYDEKSEAIDYAIQFKLNHVNDKGTWYVYVICKDGSKVSILVNKQNEVVVRCTFNHINQHNNRIEDKIREVTRKRLGVSII